MFESTAIADAVALWRDRFTGEEEARLLFDSVREAADWARYWQDPDDDDVMLETVEARSALAPVADFVATCASARWWSAGLESGSQVCVQFVRDECEQVATPSVADGGLQEWHGATVRANQTMRRDREAGGEERWAMTSGSWWTPPIFGGVVSSARALDPWGPVGLWLVEDAGGEDRARTWPLSLATDVRVFEINGPSSWAELVSCYPLDVTYARGANWLQATGRDGAWLIPDWEAVSADYDGVHLSVEGYLTTSGQVVAIDGNHASFVAGWEPDASYWLTDVVTVGAFTEWIDLNRDGAWTTKAR